MKHVTTTLTLLLLLTFSAFSNTTIRPESGKIFGKDPVVIVVLMKDKDISNALLAAKTALLQNKFIVTESMQAASFTAKRTTGAHADYYVADVTAVATDGKIKLTVTFIKFGTGFLKLQKIADAVKAELEK